MRGSIHHIDITVSDLERSIRFYGAVLPLMGFRYHDAAPEGPVWAGEQVEIGLVRARAGHARHDRYSPGLHHLAFAAPSRSAIDRLHEALLRLGVEVLDAPAQYDQYARGYYAVFFADPDGIKLEYAHVPG